MRVGTEGLKRAVEIYGSEFESTFIKYALRGVAKLCGEEPASNVKTLDQLEEYLNSKVGQNKCAIHLYMGAARYRKEV